jgi:hypothetical protein
MYLQHLFCHFVDGKIRDLLKTHRIYRIFTSLQLVTFMATHYVIASAPTMQKYFTALEDGDSRFL